MPLITCPDCNNSISDSAVSCPNCGRPMRVMPTPSKSSLLPFVMGLIGSLLLFFGVFAPLVRIPIAGSQNYFHSGHGDGVIIIVLAVVSMVLVLTKRYQGLWFTGIPSLAMMIWFLIGFTSKMREATTEMQKGLEGNPFSGLGELAVQSISIEWGAPVLILGAVTLLTGAVVEHKPLKRKMFYAGLAVAISIMFLLGYWIIPILLIDV